MRGGLVFFRGAGAAARAYLESDHSHADEYYLEDGGAVADWTAFDGAGEAITHENLDGATYQAWVDWKDPQTGAERGKPRDEVRVRQDGELRITPSSPRFVEMTVNCDKSLSVAAALDPAVSAALDEAQTAAATAMNRYMAHNSVTRVGSRGAQRFVPVERLESVSVVHRSSRAGDPHRHVHVQWSTRVYAEGSWRALHTAATLKQQGALRGVGEAAINSHEGLRRALAVAGFTFDAETGKVTNLADQSKALSKRARQIERNVARFEAEWREAHPGAEPDRAQRLAWDQQAWAHERPRKRKVSERPEAKWIDELRNAGMQVGGFSSVAMDEPATLDRIDVDRLRVDAIAAAESRGSAWSVADLEGHVGVAVAAHGVLAEPEQLNRYVRDVAQQIAHTLPTLETDIAGEVPLWVRNLSSDRVLRVERELRDALTARGLQSGFAFGGELPTIDGLNQEQSAAAVAIGSGAPLVVVEGAAGAGKTTMLRGARDLAAAEGRTLMVVAPTLRAAQEASAALGTRASSAHKLVHEHGYRWTEDGRWMRLALGDVDQATGAIYEGPSAEFALTAQTRIVVDEAGMIDQDLAHALVTIADESGAGLGFIGDRAQLPAVGRGGVLDLAIAAHPRPLDLTEVHRFADPEYAALTIRMRDREEPAAIFDELARRDQVKVHDSDAAAWDAITRDVVEKATAGADVAVAVTSNEAAANLNALVQDAHARAGHTRQARVEVAGTDGLAVRIGDRLMTRKNDTDLGVANRDTWTVDRVHRDGSVSVVDGARSAKLPREYVEENTHLAYAATEYGVQGATVDFAHGVVTDSSSAQAVYVSATRGRLNNTLHIVAGDRDEARKVFTDAMTREAGDRGVEAARAAIARDLDGIVLPQDPGYDPQLRDQRIAAEQRVHAARVRDWEAAVQAWEARHPEYSAQTYSDALATVEKTAESAHAAAWQQERTTAAAVVSARAQEWATDYARFERAEAEARQASVFRRRAAEQARDEARQSFEAKYRTAPVPSPTVPHREAWERQAIAPGADPKLDAARKKAREARSRLENLRADAPPGARPAPPKPGSPEQEAAKDAAFRKRQQQREKQQSQSRERTAPTVRQRGPRGPEL